jgi:hypothetical protein
VARRLAPTALTRPGAGVLQRESVREGTRINQAATRNGLLSAHETEPTLPHDRVSVPGAVRIGGLDDAVSFLCDRPIGLYRVGVV